MKDSKNEQLEQIYRRYAKSLYYYLLHLCGSPSNAEDLVQETFCKATISLSFNQNQEVQSWLFKVARHAYLDEWRRRKRWEWVPFVETLHQKEILSPYEQPEDYVLSMESKEEVFRLYSRLPENYRTILYLRNEKGLTYKELSDVLGVNENQVKVTLYRARKRIQELAGPMYKKEGNE